jgi:hypothetical protein
MHPVSYDTAYEVERSRATTFFRAILAIPWFIYLSIYGIGALVVVVIAWFAMLFTKRYPERMYGFVSGYVRLAARTAAFFLLLTYSSSRGRPS